MLLVVSPRTGVDEASMRSSRKELVTQHDAAPDRNGTNALL